MKRKILTIILILILPSLIFSQNSEEHFRSYNKEADTKHHNGRKHWLESMHRTENGVDYKILRNEIIKSRRKINNELRKKSLKDIPNLLEYVSDNGKVSGTWQERGSNNQSGRIHTADIDLEDSLIYAASAGGNVWRGSINGEEWTCLNNSTQFNINSIKVEIVNNKRRIFVFDNKNMYYSDDEGYVWEHSEGLENIGRWGWITRGVVINHNSKLNIYLLANEWDYNEWKHIKSVYYSSDNGLTFTKVFSVNNTDAIDIWGIEHSRGEYGYQTIEGNDKVIDDNLYCIHLDTLFSVKDTKMEIKNILNELTTFKPNRLNISGTDAGNNITLYINASNANQSLPTTYILNSLNGQPAKKSVAPERYFQNNSFAVSKLNPNKSFLGGVLCYISEDNANTWNAINNWPEYYPNPKYKLHADIPGLKSFRLNADKELFLISTDGGIYKSYGDNVVENISLKDLNVSQYYSIYSYRENNNSYIFAGSQDQGFQRSESISSNKILDFEQTISGDYGSLSSGNFGKSLWSVYPGFAMFYEDMTEPKITNASWNFNNLSNYKVWMPPIAAIPGDPYSAYIAPGSTSDNASKIWVLNYDNSIKRIKASELPYRFNTDSEIDNYVTAIAVSPIDINYVYALTRKGKFYSSKDGGLTWLESPEFIGPGFNYLHGTSIYPSKSELGKIFISGSGYSNPAVFFSDDNGVTFNSIEGLEPCMVYQIDMNTSEDVLFAATSIGPYIYILEQNKWYHIAGLDAPEQHYWSVNYLADDNIARFATYGRGIWDFKINNLVTSINDDQINPNIVINLQPNPIIDDFTIIVDNAPSELIEIKLFDLNGRLISLLFEGNIDKALNLDFKMSDYGNLSSGNYLIILKSKGILKYLKLNYTK